MDTLQKVLAVIGGVLALVVLLGGLYAVWRSADRDARIKRLQEERDDYLSRLNYIEPRLRMVEQQNEVLMALHNPSDQIEQLAAQERANHEQTVRVLEEQSTTLRQIDRHLLERGTS